MSQESTAVVNPRYRRYIHRLEALIERGDELSQPANFQQRKGYPDQFRDDEDSERYSGWQLNCHHILGAVFGEESVALKRFLRPKRIFGRQYVRKQVSILSAALEDLKGGFLLGQEMLVAGAVYDDVLAEASALQRAGHARASAVLARTVLEGALRRLARAMDIDHTGKIGGVNDRLKDNDIYHQARWRRIRSLLDIGNAAAHSDDDWAQYSHADVAGMIDDIEGFLAIEFQA